MQVTLPEGGLCLQFNSSRSSRKISAWKERSDTAAWVSTGKGKFLAGWPQSSVKTPNAWVRLSLSTLPRRNPQPFCQSELHSLCALLGSLRFHYSCSDSPIHPHTGQTAHGQWTEDLGIFSFWGAHWHQRVTKTFLFQPRPSGQQPQDLLSARFGGTWF